MNDHVATVVLAILAVIAVTSQFVVMFILNRRDDIREIKGDIDELKDLVRGLDADERIHADHVESMQRDISQLKRSQHDITMELHGLADEQRNIRNTVNTILHNQGDSND